MPKTIAVEIISPERQVSKTSAEAVVVPAWDGEMGILPGHEPYLAQLRAGEVRLRNGGGADLFAVAGGFVEVSPERVRLFVETAELAEEIDLEKARQAAEKAKAEMSRKDIDPAALAGAEGAMRWAMAQVKVARRHRHSHGRPAGINGGTK
ncbi:MAG TPA: ATP synthase F1 subunit epsilon [Elusimicrobiota bacterium]|nr:ATP synthase F1 subunit epsilon [Elusimicrobiota bacterium]